MENVDMWSVTPVWLEVVFNALLLVIPPLAGLAVLSASGATMIATVQKSWKLIRPAIDEPTDPIILLIAAQTGLTPEQVSAWLLENFGKVIEALPIVPAPELNITASWVSSDVAQAMPDGTRQETAADMGTAPAIGVGVGVSDAAEQQAAG